MSFLIFAAAGPALSCLFEKGLETGAKFLDKQARLLKGCEMAAFVEFIPMDQLRRAAFGPAPRRLIELLREDAIATGQWHGLIDHKSAIETLPIETCR